MSLPQTATREQWRAARVRLLQREKQLTRARDALNVERRKLPMVEIETAYRFTGPDGEATLLDLFEGRRQLIVSHFMFDPRWEDGCPSCSAGADEVSDGLRAHLATRDTTLAHVSRAPLERIERYKARKGWTFPWYSSYGSDFNADFGVTLDPASGHDEYNFQPVRLEGEPPFEVPGVSCFLRDGERVFHTYSVFARGTEWFGGSYAYLDLTALGRQEEWEQPQGRADLARAARPDFAS